jgi:dTDP-4-dehydrorhamnose reductase
MRWLITGAHGQLGSDLVRQLGATANTDGESADAVRALSSSELDITDSGAVESAVAGLGPDLIVNAAAYTAVDAAEDHEELAYRVNAAGPALLAAAAARHGARLIHVSTDYVFAGTAGEPYDVDAEPAPASAYGRTKLAGEQAVRELHPDGGYVVRTAWVYGATGRNFVKTMVRLERERDSITVVDDQRGSPTWSADLARGLVELGRSAAPVGIYHCTGAGDTTWCGLARAVFVQLGADPERVRPITTAEYPVPAPRPAYSILSDRAWRAAGLTGLPRWDDALAAAFAAHGEELRAG